MTGTLFASLLAPVAVEYFLRAPLRERVQMLTRVGHKSARTLASKRISDHWKEVALLGYARQIAVHTLATSAILIGALALIGLLALALDKLFAPTPTTLQSLSSVPGLLAMTVVSLVYLKLRPTTRAKAPGEAAGGYGLGDRLLHRVALGVPLIRSASFDLDAVFAGRGNGTETRTHVFISGLARAGTTVLMRAFHDTGRFRSLTYRDMPFVLMPNAWKRLSAASQKRKALEERAHGDRILVDFDSPEAFEEVFWGTFCGREFVFPDHLQPHTVDEEVIDQFREYVRRILVSSGATGGRYLSKNNNNVLRLDAIHTAFPQALILVPFRDPVQQAGSLLVQHRLFSEVHGADRFAYRYMEWLGHHEFGLTHKPFRFPDDPVPEANPFPTGDINYWLWNWTRTYRYLLEHAPPECIFVCYEKLCDDPSATLGKLFQAARLPVEGHAWEGAFTRPPDRGFEGISDAVHASARQVYQRLLARS